MLIPVLDIGFFDATLLIVILLSIILWFRSRRPSDYPPGPTPLPLIGNFQNLIQSNILEVFRNLRIKYGDIFSLSLGKYWIIVVNGEENLRELLVKKGDLTVDRPPFFVFNINRNKGIVSSSGSEWKHQRTFALSKLRGFGFGKRSFESRIQEEIEVFLNLLNSFNEKPLDMCGILQISMSNNIMSISIGRRFAYDDPKFTQFIRLLNENINTAALAGPLNFIPILAKLPGDPFKGNKIINNTEEIYEFLKEELEDHKKSLDKNNIRDFVDCYLIEMEENNAENLYTEDQLLSIISDLFIVGSETSATTIRWALVYLMNNMDMLKKMREEIDDVVGSARFPSLADKSNLPYCEAVILETLRLGNIAPFALPHKVSEDIHYKGYTIPKDSVIMPCIESVSFDENLFPDSQRFKPERFIDEKNTIVGHERVLSFSLGRRVCLGEAVARMEIFLYLTTLVQRFEFLPPEGENPPSTKGTLAAVHAPPSFKLRAIPRN